LLLVIATEPGSEMISKYENIINADIKIVTNSSWVVSIESLNYSYSQKITSLVNSKKTPKEVKSDKKYNG
jgi:hypothetical protein